MRFLQSVLGASAGAHLALLQGHKYSSPKVQAVIDLFSPTDMAALYKGLTTSGGITGLKALLAGTPQTNPAMYQASSPNSFVSTKSPPTLIFKGGNDRVVPIF